VADKGLQVPVSSVSPPPDSRTRTNHAAPIDAITGDLSRCAFVRP